MSDPVASIPETMRFVPANLAGWQDARLIFGRRGQAAQCLCQRMRLPHRDWHDLPSEARADRLRAQIESVPSAGLVAYAGEEPVGWCAVGPRVRYLRLMQTQSTVPWAGRSEERTDATVWAVTCLVTRAGFRRRGIARAMIPAAVAFARENRARALEAYPMRVEPGEDVPWGDLHVGAVGMFAAAGFREVSRPSPRRVVMRVELDGAL